MEEGKLKNNCWLIYGKNLETMTLREGLHNSGILPKTLNILGLDKHILKKELLDERNNSNSLAINLNSAHRVHPCQHLSNFLVFILERQSYEEIPNQEVCSQYDRSRTYQENRLRKSEYEFPRRCWQK
jgi:hypothetical protein